MAMSDDDDIVIVDRVMAATRDDDEIVVAKHRRARQPAAALRHPAEGPAIIVAVLGNKAGTWQQLCKNNSFSTARSQCGLEAAEIDDLSRLTCLGSTPMLLGFCVVKSWEICAADAASEQIAAMHSVLQSRWTSAAGYVHYPVLGAAYLETPVPCTGIGSKLKGAGFMNCVYAAASGVM
eukprot:6324101-Heterocapsa_arctica.AAC.1